MLSRGLRNVLIALTIIIAIIVVILLFVRFALPRIMVRVLLSEKESFLIDTEIQEEIRVFRDTAIGGLREAGISEEDAIGILEQVKTKKVLKGLDRLRQEQITDPAIAFDIMFEELNIEGLKEVVENASGMSINELKTNLRGDMDKAQLAEVIDQAHEMRGQLPFLIPMMRDALIETLKEEYGN